MPQPDQQPGHVWKLVAVLMAFLLWRATTDERVLIRDFEIPISYDDLNPGLAVVGEPLARVVVRVQAAEPVIKNLTASDIQPQLDIAALGVGTSYLHFYIDEFRVPHGVRVVEVFPSIVTLNLERKINALVVIEPSLLGQPAEGYVVQHVEVRPPRVRVEGPESVVRSLEAARTESVNIEGHKASLNRESFVVPGRSDLTVVGPRKVQVRVMIDEVTEERTVAGIPIAAAASPFESRVRPSGTDVTVEGPRSLVSSLSADDIEASVSLDGLEPASTAYKLPVKISFRSASARGRLRVTKLSRDTASVRIYNRRLATGDGGSGG